MSDSSSRLRVLYIAPEYPNKAENAAQVRANRLLPELAALVDLYVMGFASADLQPQPGIATTVVRPGNTGWTGLAGLLAGWPGTFYRYGHSVARAALRSAIAEHRPHIVHYDSLATLSLADVDVAGARRVAHLHDAVSMLVSRQVRAERNPLKRLARYTQFLRVKRVEREHAAAAQLRIVDSETDAQILRQRDGGTVAVVPLGVEIAPPGAHYPLPAQSIVFSGSMRSAQSVEAALYLVRAVMPRVWEKNPDAQLYLVGANPAGALHELAAADRRVHVTGFVDDLFAVLRAADVYVCPLRLGSGMRTRVLEALGAGCAMVSTAAGIEGIKGERAWIEAESADAFAAGITLLLNDRQRRLELSARAVALVEQGYSWSAVAERIVSLYQQVVFPMDRSLH